MHNCEIFRESCALERNFNNSKNMPNGVVLALSLASWIILPWYAALLLFIVGINVVHFVMKASLDAKLKKLDQEDLEEWYQSNLNAQRGELEALRREKAGGLS